MTTYKLAVIPGPGIGAEVVAETIRLLDSTCINFDYRYMEIGYEVFKKTGTSVPDDVLTEIRKTQACLFGATTTPVGVPGYKSAIITLTDSSGVVC